MITSFEVGSVFKIVDQSSPALRAILKQANALDAVTASIQKNLTSIARTRLVGVGNQLKAITADVARLDKAMAGAFTGMTRFAQASAAMSAGTAQIAGAVTATQALAASWTNVAAQATAAAAAMRGAGQLRLPPPARPPALPPPLPGAGGGRGGHGGRGPGGFHFGRFGASVPVLGGHVHASTPSTATGVAVGAGLFGVYELGKYAMEPQHQEAMLRLLGIPEATIARMASQARDIAVGVPGSGYAHNLQTMGELYSIVGAEGAMALAPRLAEIDRVQALVGGKGKEQGSAYVLTRATELMGKLTNPATHQVDMKLFGDIIDNMSKMSIASHGKVTPEEWLNYAKQAGPASGNLTTEGLYTTAAIIQAMGGQRAGTAAAAIMRQFGGGVMTASKAKELESIGIFKPGDYEVGRGGHVTVKNEAGKSFVDKLQHDPLTAVVQDLIPALETHGFATNEQITKELYRILGTATSQREIYEIIRGREQIRQERERAMAALPPSAALGQLNQNDPVQVMGALSTAFKDLLGAVGGPLAQAAIPGMVALTNAFNRISQIASEYQKVTGFVGSIGAGAAAGGAAGFGIGWLGGPVGAGGGALIGAGAGAGYGLWNVLPEGARSGASAGFTRGNSVLPGLGGVVGGGIGGIWGGLGDLWGTSAEAAGGRISQLAKNILMVTPPPQKVEVQPAQVTINMDGRKVGEAIMAFFARQGQGPAQGAPSFDPTRGTTSFDYSLAPG
ncbi:hypothetical protein [Bradyrhizobium sp.]|uniref:hypothetical protein n=1 Tax=Bradyrhizobium sp. TaxID=376 RepID=UPI001EC5A495|nr:hypothetical protein [Bradyrhizobium sp.]MBV9984502.1 hypothetical protein [Bradyrhizobium sp.]